VYSLQKTHIWDWCACLQKLKWNKFIDVNFMMRFIRFSFVKRKIKTIFHLGNVSSQFYILYYFHFFCIQVHICFVSNVSIGTQLQALRSNLRDLGLPGEKLLMPRRGTIPTRSSFFSPSNYFRSYWNSRTLWTSASHSHTTHTYIHTLIYYFSWHPESFFSICSAHCR